MRKKTFYLIIMYLVVILSLMFVVSWAAHAEGYIIGAEDMLQISVWGNSDLNVHVPVRPDGMISMPLIGDVKAEGKTPRELKAALEKELKRYVKAPVVSVTVTAINSFKVYVFGDGVRTTGGVGDAAGGSSASAGQITLRRNTTLLQLLAQLGSLSNVDFPNAYLLRDGKKVTVNFEQLISKGDYSQDVKLEPNDTIYLPGGFSSRVRVTGAVRTPGAIPYSEGMTALDAVLSAGGFTEFASQNNVQIARKEGGSIKKYRVRLKDVMDGELNKNLPLKPGDVLIVDTSWF
jgi:polysaccharide export outer membrane protein